MTSTRLFAVCYAVDIDALESYATFRRSVEAIVEADVVPHLAADRPNLVAFPEHQGMLAYLLGSRGGDARAVLRGGGTAIEALVALAAPYGPQIERYIARFGDVGSAGRLLQLALTDTAVRAVVETFSDLARMLGAHVTVGADLADWERVSGEEAAILGDPEVDTPDAYAATTPEVRNRNLVFSPAGDLLATQDKVHLVPLERDQELGLGLTPGGRDEIDVVDLGFARLGTVISKDAWMVDVNDRLEQLDVDLLVQPEAYESWSEPNGDVWPPDKLQRGGWWMVQKHPSHQALVMPTLVGAVGDLTFDGQPAIAVPAGRQPAVVGLLGQRPERGWAAVGGWNDADDPGALADDTRRAEVAELASGRPWQGAIHTDVTFRARSSPTRRVDLATGARPSSPLRGAGTQFTPALAADGDQILCAWADATEGGIRLSAGSTSGTWTDPIAVAPWPDRKHDHLDAQWAPSVVVTDDGPVVAFLGFQHESWDVYVAAKSVTRVDDAEESDGVLRERGHSSPRLIATGDGLVAVWSDLRWPWVKPQIRRAESHDNGTTWSPSVRVDGGPTDGRDDQFAPRDPGETRGQAFPSACVTEGRVLVAWQEQDAQGRPTIHLDSGVVASGERPAYRPVLAADGATVWLVYEEEAEIGRHLVVRTSPDGDTWGAPVRLPHATGSIQRHAATVVNRGCLVTFFEDSRTGCADVLAAAVDAAGSARLLGRVSDNPHGAHARAPTAAGLSDGTSLVVAWQDTRDGVERVRVATLPTP